MKLVRYATLFGVAMMVLVANVVASILYMLLYGHVIDPGHEPKFYEDHIQVAAPYCSIVAGIPIMFAAGWWVAGWWGKSWGTRGAICVWLSYVIVDLAILLIAGFSLGIVALFTVSFATKLAAVYAGAATRLRQPAESSWAS